MCCVHGGLHYIRTIAVLLTSSVQRGIEAFGGSKRGGNGGSGDMRQKRMQLADAFSERGGAGLENVSGFDLVNVVVADGGDAAPAGTGADEILIDLHAAPGADDNFGI